MFIFPDLNIEFKSKNIILGTNGSGKTTVLNIINSLFNCLLDKSYEKERSLKFLASGTDYESEESFCEIEIVVDKNNILFDYLELSRIISLVKMNQHNPKLPNFKNVENIFRSMFEEKLNKMILKYDAISKEFTVNDHEYIDVLINDHTVVNQFCTLKFDQEVSNNIDNNNHFFNYIQKKIIILNKHIDESDYFKLLKCKNLIDFLKIYDRLKNDNHNFLDNMYFFKLFLDEQYKFVPTYQNFTYYDFKDFRTMSDTIESNLKKDEYDLYTNKIRNLLAKTSIDYNIKKNLIDAKRDNNNIYNTINRYYSEITSKNFTVEFCDRKSIDIEYYNQVNNSKYKCSSGEHQLINILYELYCDQSSILLIDEPTYNLYTTNSMKIGEIISNLKKQIIVVTHDKELINKNTVKNLIHFTFKNNVCASKILTPSQQEQKLILENKEMLFANKVILVEGYNDFRFYSTLVDVIKETKNKKIPPTVYPMGGCGSQLYKLLDDLNVHYGIIFDYDKIFGSKDREKVNENNIVNYTCFKYIKEHNLENLLGHVWEKILNCTKKIKQNVDDLIECFHGLELIYIYYFLFILSEIEQYRVHKDYILNEINGLKNSLNTHFNREKRNLYDKLFNKIEFESVELGSVMDIFKRSRNSIEKSVENFPETVNDFDFENLFTKIIGKTGLDLNIKISEIIDLLNKSNKRFILNYSNIDLEGLCKYSFDFEVSHNNWNFKTNLQIYESIRKNFYNQKNRDLINFCENFF
ncbi:ATP-dependent endonuclease [Catovirus CTV1]|uniref:ATP-dependent endonuclease n=1 Tax=Catovirus CTV1 TaxID=1977631 RepID=A0A1V0S9W3_9VIRU|nr:ATP-dependent endonuclease [Catovirus CTV1]